MFAERYILQEQIGTGRMSSVHLARDSAFGDAEVAVKILNTSHPDEIKRELFKRETGALKRLSHQNIVGLRHSGWSDSDGAFYLVLDYLPYSLDRYLKGELHSQLGNFQPYRVMRELAEALVYAHSEQVIHRDIKPSNILLDVNGHPMLTDFGISKLLTHLTVGETLAGFWSGGYASPEQRANEPAAPSSDIYSLGAVFFHLLSGREPPPEGPTPSIVDEHVNSPIPIRNVLKRMLAANPEERLSGGDLLSALEVTRRHETLPTHFLKLTRTALRDIQSTGYSATDDFQSAKDALIGDLGGMELDEVHIHRDQQQPENIIILGDSLRLIGAPDREGDDALAVIAVHTPHGSHLDREKERSMPYRAMWEPVEGGFRSGEESSSLAEAAGDLADLLAKLGTYETKGVVSQEQRRSRQDFIERWDRVLNKRRNEIEGAALEYSEVTEESYYLRFTLCKPPPDDLDWQEDDPLVVSEARQVWGKPIGNLVEIRGRVVEVARQTDRSRRDDSPIPGKGLLAINVMEARSAIRRQQYAVRAFRDDQMTNPNLAKVIVDPSNATRISETDLDYFQDWLSDDKKETVSRAVSINELFLIQGPPGTGKTSVIAEIVLQILRQEPDARILLTSQSNVAVDHALTQIAKAAGDSPPDMVRLGRAEKIGHGGRKWTLEARARSWREEVLDRCNPVTDELRKAERKARAAAKEVEVAPDSETETIEEWITEAKDLLAEKQEYEQEYASLGSNVRATTKAAMSEGLNQKRAQMKEYLSALNALLPQSIDMQGMSDEDALAGIIKAHAAASSGLSEPEVDDPTKRELRRIQELRKILRQWTSVVGRGADFQGLIGESARVMAATCLFSGNRKLSSGAQSPEISFAWAIVDEAGRATVPEALIPIVRAERAILVGDERQLPPMVEEMTSDESDESSDGHSLDTSLFQSLVEQAEQSGREHLASLRTQYRMHSAIGKLISVVFYDGKLEQGELTRVHRRSYDWMPATVTWVSTSDRQDKIENHIGQSYANFAEADLVLQILEKMEDECRNRRWRPAVGVISGYSAQVQQLTTIINPEDDRWHNLQIEIATVDSFQGRECDVVVYSTVRSNRERRIGFLRDYRRVNVALSRARDLLMIVGDHFMMQSATIESESNPFASVIDYIRSNEDECKIIQSQSDEVKLL